MAPSAWLVVSANTYVISAAALAAPTTTKCLNLKPPIGLAGEVGSA
jgi:hypothetical protein